MFFPRLAAQLRAAGARTTRINLCLGDQLFWHGPKSVNYRGTYRAWPLYIETFLKQHEVTDLVLLGEQRYYHREAVAAAKRLGITVTVTDFGYLRPDWITLEQDGMSGASRFPRDPGLIRALAKKSPTPDWPAKFVDDAKVMAKGDLLHNFSSLFGFFLFPFYRRSDRRPSTPIYFPACGLRLWSNTRIRPRTERFVQELITSGDDYYLFPLQLNFDFQIIAYSPYATMADAIEEVLASFAKHAPSHARLIIKEHPWDPAIINWERVVRRRALAYNIAARVDYLRGGNLDTLIRSARGVVTVNSTVGIRSLWIGRPLKVLGKAIYDIRGLTHAGSLDSFWLHATPPDLELTQDFLQALAGTVMIRGAYFNEQGLDQAVKEATNHLLGPARL